jgi:hypothetical protein
MQIVCDRQAMEGLFVAGCFVAVGAPIVGLIRALWWR